MTSGIKQFFINPGQIQEKFIPQKIKFKTAKLNSQHTTGEDESSNVEDGIIIKEVRSFSTYIKYRQKNIDLTNAFGRKLGMFRVNISNF